MNFYSDPREAVLKELASQADGLTSAEAEARLEKNGKNKLAEGKKEGIVKKFLKQLADPMIIVLLVAAVLSAVTVLYNNIANPHETESFADVFIILFVVVLNAVLGVIQESKAEEAIAALKTMTKEEKRQALTLLLPTCIIAPLIIIFSIWESGYGVRYCVDFAWQMILGGAAVLYMLPLVLFISGYLVGMRWQLGSLFGALAFAVSIAIIVVYDRLVMKKRNTVYTIVGFAPKAHTAKE